MLVGFIVQIGNKLRLYDIGHAPVTQCKGMYFMMKCNDFQEKLQKKLLADNLYIYLRRKSEIFMTYDSTLPERIVFFIVLVDMK